MIRLNELKLPIGASEEDVRALQRIFPSRLKDFRIANVNRLKE